MLNVLAETFPGVGSSGHVIPPAGIPKSPQVSASVGLPQTHAERFELAGGATLCTKYGGLRFRERPDQRPWR